MQNSVLNSPYSCFLLCLDRRENLTVVVGAHDHIGSSRMEVKFYHIHPGLRVSLRVCEMTSYYFREMTEKGFSGKTSIKQLCAKPCTNIFEEEKYILNVPILYCSQIQFGFKSDLGLNVNFASNRMHSFRH